VIDAAGQSVGEIAVVEDDEDVASPCHGHEQLGHGEIDELGRLFGTIAVWARLLLSRGKETALNSIPLLRW
jgi:hypothetical protein